MSGGRRFSPKRQRLMIAYICRHPDRHFDIQKLLWLMFHADMEAYRLHGESITGATYVKTEWGPMPMRKKDALAVERAGKGPQ